MADYDVDLADAKESRFAHLLKPIRDMEACFNLDIAHELTEYLEQLANTQFTFECGAFSVDFAEAALLIQSSTCIYSKKVEYLCALVYQALETVKGGKRQQAAVEGDAPAAPLAGARSRGAAVARADDDAEADHHQNFFNYFPCVMEVGDNDLARGEGAVPSAGNNMRPPAALLALEDQGQGATTTTGSKGDGDAGVYRLQQCVVHCSAALLLDPQDDDLYDKDLRYIGPQQRNEEQTLQLLLEPFQQALLPSGLPDQAAAAAAAVAAAPALQLPGGQDPAAPGAMDVDGAQDPGAAGEQPPAAPMDDYYDGGGFGEDGGAVWPCDDEGAGGGPGSSEGVRPGGADGAADMPAAQPAPGRQRPTRAAAAAAQEAAGGVEGEEEEEEEDADEEAFDPYNPLDPFSRSRLPDRPLQVRKPARKRHAHASAAARDMHVQGEVEHAITAAAAGAASSFPGLLLPEFNYCLAFLRPAAHARGDAGGGLETAEEAEGRGGGRGGRRWKATVGAKEAVERLIRKRKDVPRPVFDAEDAKAAAAELEASLEETPEEPAPAPPLPFASDPYADDDGGGGFGGGGASDLDDDGGPGPLAGNFGRDGQGSFGIGADADGDAAAMALRAGRLGLWPHGVPPMGPLGGADDGMALEGAGGQELTYEELCRAHMDSMLLAATAREVQTDLARRVGTWKQRIDPVLQEEEARPAFDIQDYGERLLKSLSEVKISDGDQAPDGQPLALPAAGTSATGAEAGAIVVAPGAERPRPFVSFTVVVAGLHKYEVSRMFSAMLQLINNRNVAIAKASSDGVAPGEVPLEPFTLQLLSTDMYHRSMGAKLAARSGQARSRPLSLPAPGAGDTQPRPDQDPHMLEDHENRATAAGTQRGMAKGGRGKGALGGAKRAKKAAAPLGNANIDEDDWEP